MSKTMSFKISVFTLISTIICIIGNMILDLDIISYVCQGLGFLSFLFFLIWISQWIYEKAVWCINLIVMFMSFALAAYALALFALIPYERAFEYYVLFFYLFSLICLLSTIIFVGRIIFNMPINSKGELPSKEEQSSNVNTWICSCGVQNEGKFCSECGAAMPLVESSENDSN